MSQILVFGDSISYGVADIEGGWVARLRRFIDQKIIDSNFEIDYSVFNMGISGDTSDGVLKRIENEITPRSEGETIVLIAIGTNDSLIDLQNGKHWVEPAKYQENLEKIIKKAKKYSEHVVILGLFPADDRVNPIPWLENHAYKNDELKMYEDIAKSVANLNGVNFLPLFGLFKNDAKKFLSDGIHPNSKGHQAIYNVVLEYLQKNNIIDL